MEKRKERPVTIKFCKVHQRQFREVDGIGGERYIECPIGGWDCPVTIIVIGTVDNPYRSV